MSKHFRFDLKNIYIADNDNDNKNVLFKKNHITIYV